MPSSARSSTPTEPKWEAIVSEADFKKLEKFAVKQAKELTKLSALVRAQGDAIDRLRMEIAATRQQLLKSR